MTDEVRSEHERLSDEKVKKMLAKLIAHQESAEAIGNIAEAEAFSTRIDALFARYELERDDIIEPEVGITTFDPIWYKLTTRFTRTNWFIHLASASAEAYRCRVIFRDKADSNSNELFFVGYKEDRRQAINAFASLARRAQSLAKAYRSAHRKAGGEVKSYQDSFISSFVNSVIARLEVNKVAAPVEKISEFICKEFGFAPYEEIPLEKARQNDDARQIGSEKGTTINLGGR